MSLDGFHPAVRAWFEKRFPEGPTRPQIEGWPAIRSDSHTLIAAPTGSGKTLAAFLSAIDDLVRIGLDPAEGGLGVLPDETRILYVSPLKALSNDIEKNLAEPLAGIRAELEQLLLPDVEIRTAVRTGDTPAHERRSHLDHPPHIFVTTPESLFILLTTVRGREMLQTVRTVIVDEIHAVADDKRGSHLALTLERLAELTSEGTGTVATPPAGRPPVRIGLSATQEPIADVARFLVGFENGRPRDCEVIDIGHVRRMDLRIEVPDSPLEALASGDVWEEIYDRIAAMIEENRTTLVFVNTRRLAERVAHHLSSRIGEELVTSHHGSLSRTRRLDAERRLKAGELKALVATASLELGIDIGSIDLVCQIGSPHTIAALLQRVGRSGRKMGSIARGRLFAMSRDELVECAALVRSTREEKLDRLIIPEEPLDILAQQIVAAAASREWDAVALFDLARRSYPFRNLARETFDEIARMLSEGYAVQRGPRAAYIHYDEINGQIRGRKNARLAAITSGGAIPDVSDYDVIMDPEGVFVGSINEDFAIESLPGDIFQLGNTSWQILKIETGRVRVADAHGQPPTIPFWLGEAPSRTDELSIEVSRLRTDLEQRIAIGPGIAARWLTEEIGIPPEASTQIEAYLTATKNVLTVIPSRETLVLERFFDEAGGMQLVIHAPFGGRINRAWGLALRKRFCRGFDFELQAAANEDAIVLSLGPTHSFPLDDVFGYLESDSVRDLLVQALLAAPMFQTRWRWNACRSLAVLRMQGGKKVPAQLLRMRAEDMLVAAFPQAAACLENVVGDIEVPDHPIVQQTVEDCLVEAMDIDGLEALIGRIESGAIDLVARDVPEPSPMAHEILNARPYAFLDDAPAEERRTLAVSTRRSLDFRTADELGTLDLDAIERVREEAWPEPETDDEVHDVLLWLGIVTDAEGASWRESLERLEQDRRATRIDTEGGVFWVAAERTPEAGALWRSMTMRTKVEPPARLKERKWGRAEALTALLRGRTEGLGPTTAASIAASVGIDEPLADGALHALEGEGLVLRGHFTPGLDDGDGEAPLEWCHRRLLARIHRYTIDRLRSEIEPVTQAEFMRFLFAWQGLDAVDRPADAPGLLSVFEQLQAFEAPAAAWETSLLPARLRDYDPAWLDQLCLSGEIAWGRLFPPAPTVDEEGQVKPRTGPVRNSPLAFAIRSTLPEWLALAPAPQVGEGELSHYGRAVLTALREGGAAFAQDLPARTGLLPTQIERGLGELVAWGLATADGFTGLRALVTPESERRRGRRRRHGKPPHFNPGTVTGRWSLFREIDEDRGETPETRAEIEARRDQAVETFAWQLLARYGVVVRRLLEREPRLAPWRDVLRVLRRLEMRGEIRGGRFVQGVSGEQFALPEAVEKLRAVRKRGVDGRMVVVSGGDPLNLAGILTPGERVAALPTNRVLYRDGVPIGVIEGGKRRLLAEPVDLADRRAIESALVTGRVG